MNRFFIDGQKINNNNVEIVGEDAVHILRVLRLREGDSIELCDGVGMEYQGIIERTWNNGVEVSIQNKYPSKGEPSVKVTLFQGIPKASKMDIVIQKCVELGVYQIVPVITARTVVKLSESRREEKKVSRWQKIAEEAAKQSKRGIIPKVALPVRFKEAVEGASDDIKIIPWEGQRDLGLKRLLECTEKYPRDIAVFIGPEGGLEEQEIAIAKEHGWFPVTLGPRILRTETAGMAVVSALMFYMGEMEWK